MTDFKTARFNMVETQIRPSDIHDTTLLKAMQAVPREAFVPAALKAVAYMDEDLCVASPSPNRAASRYLMEPRVFAKLVQAARITKSDIVLEIGCATGYSSAILAQLADTVVAIESDAELAAAASANLLAQGVDNVAVMQADLTGGYPKQGPYDVIVVSGGIQTLPDALLRQLKVGGRLVAVLADGGRCAGCLIEKCQAGDSKRQLFDAQVAALPGFMPEPAFTF